MYKQVNLFQKPHEILSNMEEGYCEMKANEHAFLCGLMQEKKPEKVLEVGVAGGGTTAVIMKCLEYVNPDAKMYSVDINKECYRRKGKQTGYQLEEVKEYLANYANHKFLLGGVLPKFIEDIGVGIDFCVLDTTHKIPGELLDFLCVFPYLSDGAVIVLHDVAHNLLGNSIITYATKILLDSVTATKYYEFRNEISNIGAFAINRETKENIANVFSSLSITWAYEPRLVEMLAYRDCYKKFYDEECMELFDIFWEKNRCKLTGK